jgi:hypothetical protein
MSVLFTNNAASTLASSITSSATFLTVASGQGALFPTITGSNYFLVTLIGVSGSPIEIVKVTARSTDTFTIVRAQEGTTASAFTGGDSVQLRITAAVMQAAANSGPQAGGVIYENSTEVTSNYTMTTGKNGFSVGPITIDAGVSVTVPSGQRWVVL